MVVGQTNVAQSQQSERPCESTRELELLYGAGTYLKRALTLTHGEGLYVYDEHGKKYIDCIAGIATASLGHAHPRLVSAISEQASQIISAPELLCTPTRALYQERLLRYFPKGFERVFLCNSGAEAMEGALKFARCSTGRAGIIAFKRGFHGKTLGALSATSEEKYREPFKPLLPHVHHVSTSNLEDLQAVLEETASREDAGIGAFVFEAVQGEGGVRPLGKDFVQQAVSLAREHGALIIADEVQCGFGRTGKMWGFEHLEIEPDIVCMAKGIAGGVPMGAIAIGERVAELAPQSHTSTFGGNPLACRAALTVLEVIETEGLIENAERCGQIIMNAVSEAGIKSVREVRGRGLMIGIELKERAGKYIGKFAEHGLLCLLAGPRVIRLLPPLIISEAEATQVASIITQVLSEGASG